MLDELMTSSADSGSTLTLMARHYQTIQRLRVGMQSSLTRRGVDDRRAQSIADLLDRLENEVVKFLDEEAGGTSIYPWLRDIKGLGPRIIGMLVGLIDMERCPTVSALWRYAGLAVFDGKAERRSKGEKLHFNMTLKKTLFLISRQFLMNNNELYRGIYEERKARYASERPDWTPLHRDLAARRAMLKIFLQHLWVEWRTREGLSVSQPYVHAIMGHAKMIEPRGTSETI